MRDRGREWDRQSERRKREETTSRVFGFGVHQNEIINGAVSVGKRVAVLVPFIPFHFSENHFFLLPFSVFIARSNNHLANDAVAADEASSRRERERLVDVRSYRNIIYLSLSKCCCKFEFMAGENISYLIQRSKWENYGWIDEMSECENDSEEVSHLPMFKFKFRCGTTYTTQTPKPIFNIVKS